MGKAKYNDLVLKGYVVDRAAGVISPPTSGGKTTGGTTPSKRRTPSRLRGT